MWGTSSSHNAKFKEDGLPSLAHLLELAQNLDQNLSTIQRNIFKKQFEAFENYSIPEISDTSIGSVPIEECDEPFINVFEVSNCRISPMSDDLMRTLGRGSLTRISGCIRTSVFTKLRQVLNLLPEEFEIILCEGYRTPIQQMQSWLLAIQSVLLANPLMEFHHAIPAANTMQTPILNYRWWANMANSLMQKGYDKNTLCKALDNIKDGRPIDPRLKQQFLDNIPEVTDLTKWDPFNQPFVIPPHTTGGAIDIFLGYRTKEGLVPLNAGQGTPTFTANLSQQEKAVRKILYYACLSVGLLNNPLEFWHFESGTRLASYWESNSVNSAIYGLKMLHQMNETLIPSDVDTKNPNMTFGYDMLNSLSHYLYTKPLDAIYTRTKRYFNLLPQYNNAIQNSNESISEPAVQSPRSDFLSYFKFR